MSKATKQYYLMFADFTVCVEVTPHSRSSGMSRERCRRCSTCKICCLTVDFPRDENSPSDYRIQMAVDAWLSDFLNGLENPGGLVPNGTGACFVAPNLNS